MFWEHARAARRRRASGAGWPSGSAGAACRRSRSALRELSSWRPVHDAVRAAIVDWSRAASRSDGRLVATRWPTRPGPPATRRVVDRIVARDAARASRSIDAIDDPSQDGGAAALVAPRAARHAAGRGRSSGPTSRAWYEELRLAPVVAEALRGARPRRGAAPGGPRSGSTRCWTCRCRRRSADPRPDAAARGWSTPGWPHPAVRAVPPRQRLGRRRVVPPRVVGRARSRGWTAWSGCSSPEDARPARPVEALGAGGGARPRRPMPPATASTGCARPSGRGARRRGLRSVAAEVRLPKATGRRRGRAEAASFLTIRGWRPRSRRGRGRSPAWRSGDERGRQAPYAACHATIGLDDDADAGNRGPSCHGAAHAPSDGPRPGPAAWRDVEEPACGTDRRDPRSAHRGDLDQVAAGVVEHGGRDRAHRPSAPG